MKPSTVAHIREISNSKLPDGAKSELILGSIASDPGCIEAVLEMISARNAEREELLLDTNEKLSVALVTLGDPKLGRKEAMHSREFAIESIKQHYEKWKHRIQCCFNIK